MSDEVGRDPAGQALVCDQAAARLAPAGFDPSRELYRALEDFDNWFAGFNPEDRGSRMEGRVVVIRARALLAKYECYRGDAS